MTDKNAALERLNQMSWYGMPEVLRVTITAALSSPSPAVDVSRVRELLSLLDTLINKSDKYHEALGGTCTDAEDSEAVAKSWSESREVALVAVMNFLHQHREALQSLPAMREACHEVEFHDLFTTLHSITITREGPDKICRKPVSEEAALYIVRTLAMEYPHGLRIKQPPSKEKS